MAQRLPLTSAGNWHESSNVQSKPTSYGGSDLVRIEQFAFDLARLDDIFCKGSEMSFISQVEAQGLHLALQAPLFMGYCGKQL